MLRTAIRHRARPRTDYERGDRGRVAVAVQIDHTLDRLLRKGANREELWPLIYEYGEASANPLEATPPAEEANRE